MINNITVIGAGTMGHTIALTFAMHGIKTNIYESFENVRNTVLDKMKSELELMVKYDYINSGVVDITINNISLFDDLKLAAKDADYVIEAIPEKLELKQDLFEKLDKICNENTIFASNTSSLKLFDMIANLSESRKAKTMICHWYNPGHLIPIAELSYFGNMSESDFNEVYELYKKCEKVPIKVLKDIPGMIANRLLHAQAREVFYLNSIGAASPEDIDKALMFGPCFRNATTGMLEVADMGGLDVWTAAEDNFLPALDNSTKANDKMRALVAEGKLGMKTGKGFYEYPADKKEEIAESFNVRLIKQLKLSKDFKKD